MTDKMLEWAFYAMDAVHVQAQTDPEYLALDEKRLALEEQYESFLQTLPEEKRELILNYQCICEEMLFQKVRLAYFLGKKTGKEFGKK